jgi:hypothetical protein
MFEMCCSAVMTGGVSLCDRRGADQPLEGIQPVYSDYYGSDRGDRPFREVKPCWKMSVHATYLDPDSHSLQEARE